MLTGGDAGVEIANESYDRLIDLSPAARMGKNLFNVIPGAEACYRRVLTQVLWIGEPVYLTDSPYSVVTNGHCVILF